MVLVVKLPLVYNTTWSANAIWIQSSHQHPVPVYEVPHWRRNSHVQGKIGGIAGYLLSSRGQGGGRRGERWEKGIENLAGERIGELCSEWRAPQENLQHKCKLERRAEKSIRNSSWRICQYFHLEVGRHAQNWPANYVPWTKSESKSEVNQVKEQDV